MKQSSIFVSVQSLTVTIAKFDESPVPLRS